MRSPPSNFSRAMSAETSAPFSVSFADCSGVGLTVGVAVGSVIGPAVGLAVGVAVGSAVGLTVGVAVGSAIGPAAVSYTHLDVYKRQLHFLMM